MRMAATLVGWAALAILISLPYALAAASPPPGTFFSGAFAFQDDFYQYISFLEQAGRGAVLFRNKFNVAPQSPALLNVAWWVGGVVGGGAGGPVEGFRGLGVIGIGLLVRGATLLLEAAGLSGRRLAWGVGLVATGGGLGWLRLWHGVPAMAVGDVGLCLYPWWEALISAHALIGTALLLLAFAWHARWREGKTPRWRWLVAATVLGLCRPFDLGVFVLVAAAIAGIRLLRRRSRRTAAEHLAELLWLAPVLTYDLLIFGFHPAFAVYSHQNVVPTPPFSTFAWALLPAAPLAALGLLRPQGVRGEHRELQSTLRVWAAVEVAFLLAPGGGFAMQFVSSLGALVLIAAALGTPSAWLPALTLAACPTSVLLLWVAFHPSPAWFPPKAYHDVAMQLRPACRPGDVLLAPIDPSLVVAALTPCHVVIGHRVLTPGFEERVEEVRRFYARENIPLLRSAYLDAVRARFVLLPAPGAGWLGGGGWRRVRVFSNFELWDRTGPLPPL